MNSKIKLSLMTFVCLLTLTIPKAYATDSAIIIFDASGSMSGKIDDKKKITIARDVMGTLVKDWNEDIELGLMAYGHRKKGSCDDIEVLQEVTKVDSNKILESINTINPLGKTPLSTSLQQAAKTLRYTEDPATVILITDGEESCNADPCAISKELEESGINFTAHVVGFDIKNNQKANEQSKCIAKNTGGQFYEAEDAASLKKALEEVKKEVEKPAATAKVTFTAIDAKSDKAINSTVEWSIINLSTEALKTLKSEDGKVEAELVEGEYEVFVEANGKSGDGKITVSDQPQQTLSIKLGKTKGTQAFDAPATIAAGEVLTFNWNGPNAEGDLIFIMKPDVKDNKYPRASERKHKVKDGAPATLIAPSKTGKYEIRYYSYANGTVLKRATLEVTPAEVNIDIPNEIPAGKLFDVSWTGPNANNDTIFIAEKKMDRNRYYNSGSRGFRVEKNKSGQLIAPAKLGDYEVRYYSYNNGDILKRVPFTVIDAEITLDTPRITSAGSEIEIKWTGSSSSDDLLFISKPDMEESKYYYDSRQSASVSDGSPAKLTAPAKKGTYEIRYYSKENGSVLARRALIVR